MSRHHSNCHLFLSYKHKSKYWGLGVGTKALPAQTAQHQCQAPTLFLKHNLLSSPSVPCLKTFRYLTLDHILNAITHHLCAHPLVPLPMQPSPPLLMDFWAPMSWLIGLPASYRSHLPLYLPGELLQPSRLLHKQPASPTYQPPFPSSGSRTK